MLSKVSNLAPLAVAVTLSCLLVGVTAVPQAALAGTGSGATTARSAPAPALQPVQKELAPDVYIQILPRMELLAGVQSQTTWMNISGPKGEGPAYFRELKALFDPYHGHEAVRLSQELLDGGFSFDAPPHFVLRLGSLPDLEKVRPYGDYLAGRGRSQEKLAAAAVINWLRDFYGWEGGVYYVVLAPAMFPGGGYGASFELEDGRMAIFQVVRDSDRSKTEPEFPTGDDLEYLTLHEWGHSFVNPTLEQFPEKVQRLSPLFTPVAGRMANQSYPSLSIFMNEQVLRATTAVAERDLNGEQAYQKALAGEESRGFYLTEHIAGLLEYYRAHRDEYATFREFAPYMLDQLAADAPQLARTYRAAQVRKWLPLAVFLVAIGGLALYRLRRRRSRRSQMGEEPDHESQPEPDPKSESMPDHE